MAIGQARGLLPIHRSTKHPKHVTPALTREFGRQSTSLVARDIPVSQVSKRIAAERSSIRVVDATALAAVLGAVRRLGTGRIDIEVRLPTSMAAQLFDVAIPHTSEGVGIILDSPIAAATSPVVTPTSRGDAAAGAGVLDVPRRTPLPTKDSLSPSVDHWRYSRGAMR